jgi:hypothetical protein
MTTDRLDETDEMDLRARAESRVKARDEFRIHLVVFVLVNALLWLIWLMNDVGDGTFWPLYPLLGWGIGLFAHWWVTYPRTASREAEIEREMQRMREGR